MPKIYRIKTRYPGVRYYEHSTRKYKGKPDRNFMVRYRTGLTQREECIGWASGGMTAEKANEILSKLKINIRTGEGPTTLGEKKALKNKLERERIGAMFRQARENITFDRVWEKYFANQKLNVGLRSWKREASLFKLWIGPVIGNKPMRQVAELDLQKIKKNMQNAERSPRSIRYALDVIRQVYNFSNRTQLIECKSPTLSITKPRKDNKRHRFLSVDESEQLLNALRKKSQALYEIALISLHCGLRAGEIFALKWSDIDLQNGRLNLTDTKGGHNRHPLMTELVKNVFLNKIPGSPPDLVFPDRNGKIRNAISKAFSRTVDELSLNKNCIDARDKVVFHSLRHTFASWLVQSGVPIYEVGKHLGHSTVSITERYAHLAPHNFENSVKVIENLTKPPTNLQDKSSLQSHTK